MAGNLLHTIGYEGSSISDFLNSLKAAGIDRLIDVREVPISRKAGFSKSKLAKFLQDVGIDYLHLKGLGDPKLGRAAAREGRFGDFQEIYTAHLRTEGAKRDIQVAVESAKLGIACLLCFERDHQFCHRELVAKQMADIGGFKIVHLGVRFEPLIQRKLSGLASHVGNLSTVG